MCYLLSWVELNDRAAIWCSSGVGESRVGLPFAADPADPMSFRNPSERIVRETAGAAY